MYIYIYIYIYMYIYVYMYIYIHNIYIYIYIYIYCIDVILLHIILLLCDQALQTCIYVAHHFILLWPNPTIPVHFGNWEEWWFEHSVSKITG